MTQGRSEWLGQGLSTTLISEPCLNEAATEWGCLCYKLRGQRRFKDVPVHTQYHLSIFVIAFVAGCEWIERGPVLVFEPRAVSHLVTWQDGRCNSSFLASLPKPASHLSVATGFGCATIFWLLKNRYDNCSLNQHVVSGVRNIRDCICS